MNLCRRSKFAWCCAIAAILCCVGLALSANRPASTFRLRFQLADFVVPAGETWRLSWKSPYQPGDIHPGYDVRVIQGDASLGETRGICARAYDWRPGKTGLLDLWAAHGEAVAWLEPGTKFTTANELLQIEASVFSDP
jgi:hypothetical protein